MRNELVSGELWAHGRRVDLADIRCPLYLLAGAKDHITPPPQVFSLADFASTPANEIAGQRYPAGTSGRSWATRPCVATGPSSSPT
jgi:poly(3-hydroxybutyrate) depolymerase